MTRNEMIEEFRERWNREHPEKQSVIVDGLCDEDYVCLYEVMKLLRVGFMTAVGILHEEGVALYITRHAVRNRYEVPRSARPGLLNRHGTDAARQARYDRAHAITEGPVSAQCPYCGTTGRQWR